MKKNITIAHNYIKLASDDAERCRYGFVDSRDHDADRIIMGALIPARFEPRTPDPKARFEVRICSFEARYESWFLCCMADLEWVLQVEDGYSRSCEELLGPAVIVRCAREELGQQTGEVPVIAPGLGRLGLPSTETLAADDEEAQSPEAVALEPSAQRGAA